MFFLSIYGHCSDIISDLTLAGKHCYYYDYTERHYRVSLDVYGFRIWKNFAKRFSDTIVFYY